MEYTDIRYIAEKIDGCDCRLLLRKEGIKPLIIIGMNPSTADETISDVTMRKIIDFITNWNQGGVHNFDSFIMLNLYPLRKTSPYELVKEHTFHPSLHNKNMEFILSILNTYPASKILLCYGDSIEIVP